MDILHHIIDFLVEIVGAWGYGGIFLLMFLESSFFPFPSEVVIIPAGYLAFQGTMNVVLVIVVGVVGSLAGALFNYYLAIHFGRTFLLKFIKEERLTKMDRFFQKHGPISTFNGRLLPVVRQYISFPAGLAKMPIAQFSLYTSFGAGIWVGVLATIGYLIGDKEDLIKEYLQEITIGTVIFVAISTLAYVVWHKYKK